MTRAAVKAARAGVSAALPVHAGRQVGGYRDYLGGRQIPSCAATGLKNAYGLIQADLAFLKGDPAIFDEDLLGRITSVGYDQGNQVTADAAMVQQAIAKLKGELPAGG